MEYLCSIIVFSGRVSRVDSATVVVQVPDRQMQLQVS